MLISRTIFQYRGNDGRCLLPPGPADPSQRVFVDELKSLSSDEGQIADWIVEKGPVSFGQWRMDVKLGSLMQRRGAI
jgi:hypothetical protein